MLTGASEFSEESDGYQFEQFYNKRWEILDAWSKTHDCAKKKEYDALILYLNQKLWPHIYPVDSRSSRLDSEERQLLDHVAGGGDTGVGDNGCSRRTDEHPEEVQQEGSGAKDARERSAEGRTDGSAEGRVEGSTDGRVEGGAENSRDGSERGVADE